MSFHSEMEDVAEQLRKQGHDVKVPLLRIDPEDPGKDRKISIRALIESKGGVDAFPEDHPLWDEKAAAIDDHFEKVAWADAILVANHPKHGIDGYIGGNTLMELGVAWYLRKGIYLLFPVSSELQYKEEILGMKPVVIQNDLSRLNRHEHATV